MLSWRRAKVAAVWLLLPLCTRGQQTPAPGNAYILRVYEDLVQVPALILQPDLHPVPALTKEQIFIRIDDGPPFHPPHMHIEGDEPISLSILIDASGGDQETINHLSSDAMQLAHTSLSASDHVSVFALDCQLVRAAIDLPSDLGTAIQGALATPTLHNGKTLPTCAHSLKLWDASAMVAGELSQQTGRKVLILISAGMDRKSEAPWRALAHYAIAHSIAIFALHTRTNFTITEGLSGLLAVQPGGSYGRNSGALVLANLSEASGGLVIAQSTQGTAEDIDRILAMVRGRYILEFPPPDARKAGRYIIRVNTPSIDAFITTAGVTVPMAVADQQNGSNVIPTSPSPAIIGKRKPMSPQN